MSEVRVSIRCLVYNHAKFLRQCLDGFVMQETNFPFEAIVHDDCSTDGSQEIILEYAKKYPKIIKPILEKENVYSKGPGAFKGVFQNKLKGKYIAFCEGDDYWIDSHKLQKQVDFLESHKEYSMCSHDFDVLEEKTKEFHPFDDFSNENYICSLDFCYFDYSKKDFFKRWYTQPLSCMYRNGVYLEKIPSEKYPYFRDSVFYYYVLKEGKGAFLKDKMGVYRKHSGGIYSGSNFLQLGKVILSNNFLLYKLEKESCALKIYEDTKVQMFLYQLWKGNLQDCLKILCLNWNELSMAAHYRMLRMTFVKGLKILKSKI